MKKKVNIVPAAAFAASLIAVIFRVFQLLVVVDYGEMGFFDFNAGFFACYGLYIFFAVAALILTAGVILDNTKMNDAYVCGVKFLTSKQTAALGISFLLAACLKLYDVVFGFRGVSLDFVGEAVIFAVFALIGFMLLSRKSVRPSAGYMQLLIAVSFTVKAAALFMQDTIIVRVSDELILLLSYIASTLFFLALGRFLSCNESKHTRGKLFVCGGAAAMFSCSASLAGLIARLIDSRYMEGHTAMHPLSQIGAAIIAFTVIVILYSKRKSYTERLEELENQSENEEKSDEMPQV